jgi:peptidoglycan hydrolase-like protein with peptidoglycan-binding domain
MSRTSRLSTTVLAVLATALPIVSAAGPASADSISPLATPACTKLVRWNLQHASGFPIPASAAGSINCHLQQGYANDAVELLQQVINGCYRRPENYITVDGVFGGETRRALEAAQRTAGTRADGVYGPNTRRAFVWGGPAWDGCSHLSPNP